MSTTDTTDDLQRYVNGLQAIAGKMARIGSRVQDAATERPGSPACAEIRSELGEVIQEFVRIGYAEYAALLPLREMPRRMPRLAWDVHEFTGRASELQTSWEWIGYFPVPGVQDPWSFGFTSAAEVVEAVCIDMYRQAGDAMTLAADVRKFANGGAQ